MYPDAFEQLVNALQHFPGVGEKTARRYAFHLLNSDEAIVEELIEAFGKTKTVKPCPICGFVSDGNPCKICKDHNRDQSTLMVVAYPQDLVAIEKTGQYHGLYHVLNGVISSTKGIFPEDLNINPLFNRLEGIKEVIIAISSTLEGEMTALYLDKKLKEYPIKVTRLAHGIPMGASLDYADDLTLIKALLHRQDFEE